jgi:hypothetical protein
MKPWPVDGLSLHLGGCDLNVFRLGHICSFLELIYLHSRSSRHFHSLGFSHTLMCPIFADGLHRLRGQLFSRQTSKVREMILELYPHGSAPKIHVVSHDLDTCVL